MTKEYGEVDSPPYPELKTTALMMYRNLHELRSWAIVQINYMRTDPDVPQARLAELEYPAELPNEAVWELMSIADRFTALIYTRRIRETWDAVLREHEKDWDSKLCLQKRFFLVKTALSVLVEAFVDPETRHGDHNDNIRYVHYRINSFTKSMLDIVTPPEMREQIEPEYDEPDTDEGW
jgi:hypothetical protein